MIAFLNPSVSNPGMVAFAALLIPYSLSSEPPKPKMTYAKTLITESSPKAKNDFLLPPDFTQA